MSKDIFKIVCFFIVGMVGGIFADQIFWPYFVERPLFFEYGLDQDPIEVTEVQEITVRENVALEKAIEKVETSVVGIKSENSKGKISEGSGLVVTSDGFVVTLSDFVLDYSTSTMFIDGKTSPLRLLKRDNKNNLALLKAEENNLPTVGFGDLAKTGLGERVFLVGVDFDKSTSSAPKIADEGIVRYISSDIIETNITEEDGIKGSILFNIAGEILGINTISNGKVITIPVSAIRELIGM